MGTYGTYMFTEQSGTINLLAVSSGGDQSLGQMIDRQLSNARTNSKRFHSVSPEELVTKERLDDGRYPSWQKAKIRTQKR